MTADNKNLFYLAIFHTSRLRYADKQVKFVGNRSTKLILLKVLILQR